MAIINKTGITNGGTIEAEHVTRTIDALSGVSTDSIVATGSFTGSFKGTIPTPGTAANSTHYVVVSDSIGTAANVYSDNGLTYNPSTNVLTASGSFTGTLTGTASFASASLSASFATSASRAVSASFATTASYALNAIGAGTEYHTLTFFHTPVTNTVDTKETFIGGFPTAPASSSNAIGLICPFSCTIIRAAATSYVTALRSAAIDVDILIDGSVVDTVGTLNLNGQYDSAIATYTINVSAGQLITIGLTEAGNTNAVWSTNTTLLLKST
jgi:hypothetical protein